MTVTDRRHRHDSHPMSVVPDWYERMWSNYFMYKNYFLDVIDQVWSCPTEILSNYQMFCSVDCRRHKPLHDWPDTYILVQYEGTRHYSSWSLAVDTTIYDSLDSQHEPRESRRDYVTKSHIVITSQRVMSWLRHEESRRDYVTMRRMSTVHDIQWIFSAASDLSRESEECLWVMCACHAPVNQYT